MDKILVVEDSRALAKLLERKIQSELGCAVDVAHTLEEARTFIEANVYFAAILDLMLPDAPDGEVVDEVLAKSIPSIVLTASFGTDMRQRMLRRNIVDYVLKRDERDFDYALSLLRRIRSNPQLSVLIVDDSSASRTLMRQYLKSQLYTVVEAVDGIAALEVLAEENRIKLVITDYNMPRMDGYELTREIRKSFSREQLAIIAVSSDETEEISSKFLKCGANDYITKPFSKEEFFCRVNLNIEYLESIDAQKRYAATLEEINQRSIDEQKKAHEKQKGIIVNDFAGDERFKTHIVYQPSDILSGDSYSLFKTDAGAAFIYMIDAMGHGLLPSLTSFAVSSIVKRYVATIHSLDEMMTYLVPALRGLLDSFEQLSYSFYYLESDFSRIDYSIGGMFPSFVQDGPTAHEMKANNPPHMAFMKSINVTSIEMNDFRKLLVYSDGLIEDERFAVPREEIPGLLDTQRFVAKIDEIQSHDLEDDTSIIFFERLANNGGP